MMWDLKVMDRVFLWSSYLLADDVYTQTVTEDGLTAQNTALWDVWLDKYVKRLVADIADVDDVANADRTRQQLMSANNPR